MANGAGAAGAPPQQVQVATGAQPQGGDQQAILQALEQAISQAVDEQGIVDIGRLAQIWPQVAQQLGLNIPFSTVLQMLQQNPQILEELVNKLGLSGIKTPDGKVLSAEELAGIGGG